MNKRAWVFGFIAVAGFALTQYYLYRFITEVQGQSFLDGLLSFDARGFIAGNFANPAASFMSIDVLVAATCFFLWMVPEGKKLGMPNLWVYAALTFTVALAVAFPLFMMMRERALVLRGEAA